MGHVTESIFNGKQAIVPLADVSHIIPWANHTVPGIQVVMRHTTYDFDRDDFNNAVWISEPEATEFKAAWCRYRSELEKDTLLDLATGRSVAA